MTDLERAFKALKAKAETHTILWQYYDGPQPLRYSTQRLKELFKDIDAHFEKNWCSVAVDSMLERIELKGLFVADKGVNETLQNAWKRNRMHLDSYDTHQAGLVTGEAYIIGQKDDEEDTEIYYNDPRLVHIFYKADRPKVKEFATKWWFDEGSGTWKINLYYADRIEHYSTKKVEKLPDNANGFELVGEAEENVFGEIPVFHIRNGRKKPISIFDKIISSQDAVNKLFADMMVAAEFGAFKQRVIISDADTTQLKNIPGSILNVPAGDGIGQDSSIGEFSETALEPYLKAMDDQANFVAVQTKIPKHYFTDAGTSGISGDALVALEAPLIKRVKQIEENFTSGWQEVGAFVLKMEGTEEFDPTDIKVLWAPPETSQPTSEASALNVNVQAGLPLVTQLRKRGWTDEEIKEMEKDQDEAKKRDSSLGKILLDLARINQEKNAAVSAPVDERLAGTGASKGGEKGGKVADVSKA